VKLPRDNNLYIACIDLRDRPVVVVGAGAVALEKIDSLLHSDAKVTVVAPDAIHEIRALAESGRIAWLRKPYETNDLDGALLAIVATGVDAVARNVHADAEARGLLVNVADVPELCTFILPAVVREGPIAVAISTAGASPALAQRLRDEIGALLKRPYSALARLLHELRPWAKASLPTYEARKDFFNDIVRGDPDPLSLLEFGRNEELHERVASVQRRALNAADR
jgi:precorrin-2 dehydrogenase / sirohydrochlorin ferrochelatase